MRPHTQIDPESCWTTTPRRFKHARKPRFDPDAWFRRLRRSRMFDPEPDKALAPLRAQDWRRQPSWLRSQFWFRIERWLSNHPGANQ